MIGGNPMPENRVIHGFNVERVGAVAAIWHPAQTSIALILTRNAASNFDIIISALDFYLYHQSEPNSRGYFVVVLCC